MNTHNFYSHNVCRRLVALFLIGTLSLPHARAEVVENFFSPFFTPAIFITLGGGGVSYYAYSTHRENENDAQKDISSRKPLQKSSVYGDLMGQLIPNFLYVSGNLLFGSNGLAEHMFDATLYAGALTTLLKYTVKEKRPDQSDRLSFPSGHSATAFAFASVVGIHNPWYLGLGAYTLATFVAVSRVNDEKHYTHDVLAGATIGMAYGYGTYYVNSSSYGQSLSRNFHLLPTWGPNETPGLQVVYLF